MFIFVFCMIVDFMSSFVVSEAEVVAGDHRSCYNILNTVRITESIDSWLDQTRNSLQIPTGNKEGEMKIVTHNVQMDNGTRNWDCLLSRI